jgi:hypothetical protein
VWADRVTELVTHCDAGRNGWNVQVIRQLAAPLFEALTAFSRGDYSRTVEIMKPIRYDLVRF